MTNQEKQLGTGKWHKPRKSDIVGGISVLIYDTQTQKSAIRNIELPADYTVKEFTEIFDNMSAEEKLEFLRSAE